MTNVEETQWFRCTACPRKIRYSHDAKLHPLLDCLICRLCYINYGNGDFSKMPDGVDENGDDNYCRWCCDGGDLYGCGRTDPLTQVRCHYNFCKECVMRNVKDDPVLDDQNKEPIWICYACDKTKIAKLRQEAEAAMKVLIKRPAPPSQPKDSTPKDPSSKQSTALPATTQQAANNSIVDSTATLVNKQNITTSDKQTKPTSTGSILPSATKQATPGPEKEITPTSTSQSLPKQNAPSVIKQVPTQQAKQNIEPASNQNVSSASKPNSQSASQSYQVQNTSSAMKQNAPTVVKQVDNAGSSQSSLSKQIVTPSTEKQNVPTVTIHNNASATKQAPSSAFKQTTGQGPKQNQPQPTLPKQNPPSVMKQNNPANANLSSSNLSVSSTSKSGESIEPQKQTLKKPLPLSTQDQPTKRVKMPQNAVVSKLHFYGKINERSSREMRARFDMLLKLYEQPDLDKKPKIRLLIDKEVNALEQIMQEYQKMLIDLKKISHQ